MKKGICLIAWSALLACGCWAWGAAENAGSGKVWYSLSADVRLKSLPWALNGVEDIPAEPRKGDVWESQTLPVGNGRIGGTVYGGRVVDSVILNEVSLWSGGPNLPGNGNGYSYGPTSDKNQFGSYQPFANLVIQYDNDGTFSDYKRQLDFKEAAVRSSFTEERTGGKKIKHDRRCFVSKPDDVLVYTAKVNKSGSLSAKIAMMPFHKVRYTKIGDDTLCMRGTLANGEVFEGRMLISVKGGSFSIENDDKELEVSYEGGGGGQSPVFRAEGVPYIKVDKATSFAIIISLATDYKMDYAAQWKGSDPAQHNEKILQAVRNKKPEDIYADHLADFRSLYDRLSIDLGKTDPRTAQLPTNERLKRYRETQNDPELEATIYQYGRYMLISGSRPGNLPLNLQGIWNNKVHAAWASDYHNNINLQMCYWGAEVANLSECHLPLINFIDAMQQPLHEMTQKQFGANTRGWTTRISQNPWGGGGWSKWNPPVNAWYALHVWEHYLFTQDKEYLKNVAYPILKNICFFWEDHLKELGDHGEGLTSGGKPLNVKEHPELSHIRKGALVSPDGWSHEWGPVEDGIIHDQQLIWELFDITEKSAQLLGVDADWISSLRDKKNRLVGNSIGKGGYLQEWIVDRPDMVSGHRHTSHLIGVYPGSTISFTRTPELAKAAMKSLELRGLSGDNRRSWTWPWRTALWARFHEAERAHEMVRSYLMYNTLDNLFGSHPPMQLDGTYGMTGGMSEMLVQSHAGQIELLPALPKAWKNGSVRGLKARGGITINMNWREGRVTKLALFSSSPNPTPVTVVKNGKKIKMTPQPITGADTPAS